MMHHITIMDQTVYKQPKNNLHHSSPSKHCDFMLKSSIFWQNVMLSDETKIELSGVKFEGRRMMHPMNTTLTVKHGRWKHYALGLFF